MSSPTNRLAVEKVSNPAGGSNFRSTRTEVEAAFRTIIRWTGDDPNRDGSIETPARVARAFGEFFAGYSQDPAAILQKTFDVIEGYDEMIVLRGIRFESICFLFRNACSSRSVPHWRQGLWRWDCR
jgi:GTP cyclohydrolase I